MKIQLAGLILMSALLSFSGFASAPTQKRASKVSKTTAKDTPRPNATPEQAGQWLSEYISLKSQNKDSAMPLVKLSEYNKSLQGEYIWRFQTQLLDSLAVRLGGDDDIGTVAVVDLYDFLLPDTVSKKADVLFIKGNIAAESQDTTALKQVIERLDKLNASEQSAQLQTHLRRIREYVPADRGLGGWWLDEHYDYQYHLPDHIFNVEYIGDEAVFYNTAFYNTDLAEEARQAGKAQLVVPYSQDSLYVLWASDKINNIDPEMTTMLRNLTSTTASTVVGKLSQHNNYSTSTSVVGGVVTSLAEVGINAIISYFNKPSKEAWIREARLKKHNDRHLSGTGRYFWRKINVDGTGEKTVERKYTYNMIRMDSTDNIFWLSYGGDIYQPNANIRHYVEKHKKELKPVVGKQQYFNIAQSRKAWWNVHKYFLENGIDDKIIPEYPELELVSILGIVDAYPVDSLYRTKNKNAPEKGLVVKALHYKKQSKEQIDSAYRAGAKGFSEDFGVTDITQLSDQELYWLIEQKYMVITNPSLSFSPAYLAGIKENDIILKINEHDVFDLPSFQETVNLYEPGTTVNVTVQRKKKVLEIPVEISWAYRNKE